jgi:hypothetical protein
VANYVRGCGVSGKFVRGLKDVPFFNGGDIAARARAIWSLSHGWELLEERIRGEPKRSISHCHEISSCAGASRATVATKVYPSLVANIAALGVSGIDRLR